jgi:hypothetical protein
MLVNASPIVILAAALASHNARGARSPTTTTINATTQAINLNALDTSAIELDEAIDRILQLPSVGLPRLILQMALVHACKVH